MTAIETNEKALKEQMLHLRIRYFIDRWAPEDRHEHAEFEADFHTLIFAMTEEAMKPLQDTIASVIARYIAPIYVIKDGEIK